MTAKPVRGSAAGASKAAASADGSDSPLLEHLGEKAHAMDRQRWQRRVGLAPDTRVFIVTGCYPDVRDALVRRGWRQNPDEASPHFDLKWTLKTSEVGFTKLAAAQRANHFSKAGCITTKAGLIHTLQDAHAYTPAERMDFYPRAYDLGDANDYVEFVDEFRCVEAEKVLRAVAVRVLEQQAAAAATTPAAAVAAASAAGASAEHSAAGAAAPVASTAAPARPSPLASAAIERVLTTAPAELTSALLAPQVLAAVEGAAAAAAPPLASPTTARSGDASALPLHINLGVLRAALAVSRKRCRDWSDDMLDDASDVAGGVAAATGSATAAVSMTAGAGVGVSAGRASAAVASAPASARPRRTISSPSSAPSTPVATAAGGGPQPMPPEGVRPCEPIVTSGEWEVLRYCSVWAPGGPVEQAPRQLALEAEQRELERVQNLERDRLVREAAKRRAGAGDAADDAADDLAAGDDDDDDGDDDDDDDGGDGARPLPGARRAAAGGTAAHRAAAAARGPAGAPASTRAAASKDGVGTGKGVTEGRSDAYNSGLVMDAGGRFRDRSAVAAMQLRAWRERLAKEGGDTTVFSDSLGSPTPTVSAATSGDLGPVVPLTVALWRQIVAALAAINARPSSQPTLNAGVPRNIWIVKPAGKSRGRGIECARTLSDILQNRGGDEHNEQAWICQKYIERPLLVHGLKWDIRQWVLVSSFNPLTVWFYNKCYLRFCCYPFELDNLSNRYIHLSNNSIQKYSAGFDASTIEGNMWHATSFAGWLQQQAAAGALDGLTYAPDADGVAGNCNAPLNDGSREEAPRLPVASCSDIWGQVLLPQMRRIVATSLQAAQDRVEPRIGEFQRCDCQ